MTPFVADADFTLYVGDALEVLRELPNGSIDCCVTSPPYWGLRDYGTGSWEGGDPDHQHVANGGRNVDVNTPPGGGSQAHVPGAPNRGGSNTHLCDCGATRIDQQIGLEPTPDEFVASLVAVFREVRRVLAGTGTLWLNLGDSYQSAKGASGQETPDLKQQARRFGLRPNDVRIEGLKQKDLVGIPWLVAFALRADGWYLRSDIIWAKPNPMPESVTDRPTKAHEYLFLLTKNKTYYYDAEALREGARWIGPNGMTKKGPHAGQMSSRVGRNSEIDGPLTRNGRSVWGIATQPYAEAHFATFPEELPRRCIAAGCPQQVCAICGKPRERILERTAMVIDRSDRTHDKGQTRSSGTMREPPTTTTTGWSECSCNPHAGKYRPGVVLDPFMGSGTTALAARKLGRRSVGIELNPEYAALCARRLQQLSLLT